MFCWVLDAVQVCRVLFCGTGASISGAFRGVYSCQSHISGADLAMAVARLAEFPLLANLQTDKTCAWKTRHGHRDGNSRDGL